MYAVAVRDTELLLVLRIKRNLKGEVFVLFPRSEREDWDPHTSYHADGYHHQKAFDKKLMIRKRANPDDNFRGSENLLTTGVASDEPAAIGVLCKPGRFADVLEIPIAELSPQKYRTYLAVDLIQPGAAPVLTPCAVVLRQKVFQDAIPWISVTLFNA
jgi:hypothetical protein